MNVMHVLKQMLGLQHEEKQLHYLCLLKVQELLMANGWPLQEFVCLPQLDYVFQNLK